MSHSEGSSRIAIFAALAANLAIAGAKFVAFLVTGSSSLMSESIHSLADSTNQALLLLGGRHAKTLPDRAHPFGRSGARYVYGFVVAIIILVLGGIFSLYEGWHKLHHPEPLTHVWVGFVVLIFAIIAEGLSLRTALRETKSARSGIGIFTYIRRTRDPEFPVLLVEDSGALLGLLLALVAFTGSAVTGNGVWDGVGSFAIGMLLIFAAVLLAAETGSLLIGESALPEESNAIAAAIPDGQVLTQLIHLRTLHIGPQVILVAAKVAVPEGTPIETVAEAIDEAELRVRASVPDAQYIFIEPDIMRGV